MSTRLKRLLLIVLIALIALTALACSGDKNDGGSGQTPGDSVTPGGETINKSIVFEDIRNALVNAGAENAALQEGIRNVTSEYNFRANGVNLEIEYYANYDLARKEDSQLMLRMFNYTEQSNVVFVYYDGKDLYYDIAGDRARYAGFGSSSMFDFFYGIVTGLDMSGVLYSEDFAENIEMLSTFAESTNITRLNLDETHETINVKNINLDRIRGDVNDFITENILLRSQTSSVQVRSMEKLSPPIKIISPGRVYRNDSDGTHSPVFHQLEGLVIDENVSMADLKAMLTSMMKKVFGQSTKIRFRPSFFPFTEPSVEVDVSCPTCHGKGCKVCKGTGFLELLGAGVVNPKVLEMSGIDSKKYRGFAFGFGVDRFAMVYDGITDLRNMFKNDIRFLKQMK